MLVRRVGAFLACCVLWSSVASAKPVDEDEEEEEEEEDPKPPVKPIAPTITPPRPGALGETASAKLACGGWSYPLTETRSEIGPARFARKLEAQRSLLVIQKAFGDCTLATKDFAASPTVASACRGLVAVTAHLKTVATNVFDPAHAKCLFQPAEPGTCEGIRDQMTTLRRYDAVTLQRAELALSAMLCAQPALLGTGLRSACDALSSSVKAEAGDKGGVGPFALDAPLPPTVHAAVERVRDLTDGRLQTMPENAIGARSSLCKADGKGELKPVAQSAPDGINAEGVLLNKIQNESLTSMCHELALADTRATSCRAADIYIDERGELHLNKPLTTRAERRAATMCIDISDFDPEHPLMVTLKLGPTGSIPERMWPGETMKVGSLIDATVTAEDVLTINVFGKPRGTSLAQVLFINGVQPATVDGRQTFVGAAHDEACRIARSWVPVVDHEIPIGSPDRQIVIPVLYQRGRDGETRPVKDKDSLFVWVREMQPGGMVAIEQSDGSLVTYEPPPLLGDPERAKPSKDARMPTELRGAQSAIADAKVPRRARYGGSRTLRLGHPSGNNVYNLKICMSSAGETDSVISSNSKCNATKVVLSEKLYVHGTYHFGVRAYFGFTSNAGRELVAARTPRARAAGDDIYEVVGDSQSELDMAVLFALHPFGRDPYRFTPRTFLGHVALLGGFTVRKAPWRNLYLGGSIPVANGVSLTVLANLAAYNKPIGIHDNDLISAMSQPNLASDFGTRSTVQAGLSIGVSFDYDLAERAFKKVWSSLSGTSTTTVTAESPDEED